MKKRRLPSIKEVMKRVEEADQAIARAAKFSRASRARLIAKTAKGKAGK